MKRIIGLVVAILCIAGIIGCLAACGEDEPTQDSAKSMFCVTFQGVDIELGAEAKDILEALGDAKSVKELGDCGGFGAQIKYTYDNFDIYTVKNDSGETIDQITITNDLVATSKNIINSSSKDAVINAYGTPDKEDNRSIRYVQDNLVLKFEIEDNAVSSIIYIRTSVE